MAVSGILLLVVLICGGILSMAAVAVVIYLIMQERDK